jgi:hypothetical protein
MAQTNFTPISLYYSTTAAAVPTAGNLVAGELAINTQDGKLFYKDAAGVVQTIASKDVNSGTFTNISVSGVASFADGTVSLPSITNIGDTNTGIFFPDADTIAFTEGGTESMRVNSSGNLGIGTTSPSARLHVSTSSAGLAEPLWLNNSQAVGTNVGSRLVFTGTSSNNGLAAIDGAFAGATTADGGYMAFNTRAVTSGTLTERMRIDSAGNVGIGTTSPTGKLDVSSGSAGISAGDLVVDTANKTVYVGRQSSVSGDNSYLIVRGRLNGSGTNQAIVITGDTTPYGTGIYRPNNDVIGFSTLATERMRITDGGNVVIGKTSASGTAQGIFLQGDGIYGFTKNESGTGPLGYFVNANGTVDNGYRFASFRVTSGFTEVGTITTNGSSTTAYNTSSDYRLKENIAPMVGALETVSQLKPVTYKWKVDGSDGQGFIAHELQAVVPECVTGEKDAVDSEGNPQYQGIDTSFLVATLTAAIQEQQTLIENLTTRLNALEGK